MPIDRDAALKTAERLLRQGKLDGAIEQYVRLVDEQPRDWNSINALGDLYVRAGDTERAVAQYVRIADYLFGEGFLPKAGALYKKALKVRSDHEHTLRRLSDIAARQGLLADAKFFLRQLAQQRRARGDEKGVADCVLRMASIDEDDGDAKIAGAGVAEAMGDVTQAVALFLAAASAYEKQKRVADALNAQIAAATLAPEDVELRAEVAKALIAAGQAERAQPFLSADAGQGDNVDLLLALGRTDLLAGRAAEAHATLMRVVVLAPDRQDAIAELSNELLEADRVADAYACLEILVDAALFEALFNRAASILERFVERHQMVPALLKLVDVYVDAGFDDRITVVQGRLADAYLETGQAAEARVIAEDLLAREPHVELHGRRLRRALEALGFDNPDEVIARLRETNPLFDTSFGFPDASEHLPGNASVPDPPVARESISGADSVGSSKSLDIEAMLAASELLDQASSPLAPATSSRLPGSPPAPPVRESSEVDLSSVLGELRVAPGALPPHAAAPASDAVEFGPGEGLHARRPGVDNQIAEAAALLERAQDCLRRGKAADAAAALQAAARVPKFRFRAAAQLGRLLTSRGNLETAVEWLEHAADAPAPTPDESFSVLYDLGDALERMGESVRALAVFIELESDAGIYRDVRARIEQLTRGTGTASRNVPGERR